MKKLLGLVLALMIATVSFAAFAEEQAADAAPAEAAAETAEEVSEEPAESAEAPTEAAIALSWPEYEAALKEKGWSGDFVTLEEVGLKIYLPGVFSAGEITEEEKADDMIAYYATKDESAGIIVYNVETLTQEAQVLKQQVVEEKIVDSVDDVLVNGLTGLIGTNTEQDVIVLMVKGEKNWVTFNFAPASDAGFAAVAKVMMASVQTAK